MSEDLDAVIMRAGAIQRRQLDEIERLRARLAEAQSAASDAAEDYQRQIDDLRCETQMKSDAMTSRPAGKRLLLDCDGVLSDFVQHVANSAALDLSTLDEPWPRHWDLFSDLKRFNAAMLDNPMWWRTMPPTPWAYEVVRVLHSRLDLKVAVATAPWPTAPGWDRARTDWIQCLFGGRVTNVIITESKHWIDADVFVDDKPQVVRDWARENPKGQAYLLDAPYNQEDTECTRLRGADLPALLRDL